MGAYEHAYRRSIEDPDGQIWELMLMDPAAVEAGPAAFENA
jgi:uncharacterized protein